MHFRRYYLYRRYFTNKELGELEYVKIRDSESKVKATAVPLGIQPKIIRPANFKVATAHKIISYVLQKI
jgi:hypothetical protein